jgi:LruC domain-containing protein
MNNIMKPFMKKQVLYSTIVACLAMSFGCKEDIPQITINNSATESAKGFKYENVSVMPLNLTFKDLNGIPVPGVLIRVYSVDPYESDGMTLRENLLPDTKGVTNSEGLFSRPITTENSVENLYILVDNLQFKHRMTIKKATTYSDIIYPAGYSVLRSSISARSTMSAPIPYTRATAAMPISNKLWVLGTYNAANGMPSYTDVSEPAPTYLLNRISSTLPESFNQFAEPGRTNNGYFDNVNQANLQVIADANIWVAFATEGAGVNNSVGYFYYPTNSPPNDTSAIAKRLIIFPNSSNSTSDGGSGMLVNGTKVKLRYQNPSTGIWSDIFPAGVTVSWFLTTSGWGGSSYDAIFRNRVKDQFSIFNFNKGSQPQTLLLYDAPTNKIILGFEDISIGEFPNGTSGAGTEPSDKDFNDVVFIVTANPITAVNTEVLKKIVIPGDDDGDGVPNISDDYPEDPLRAHNNYYPSGATFGSLAFEDNWPSKGDYDFNDLVLDYQVKYVTNAAGDVKDVVPTIRAKAVGADYSNGFAIELNTNAANVESVATTYAGSTTLLAGSLFSVNANGAELNQSKAVIPFFDNAYALFGAPFIPGFVNTYVGSAYYSPVEITKKITFAAPVSISALGNAPYNPFIVVNQNRGVEVHKAGKPATSLANTDLFNTNEDLTNQSTLWYVGTEDYPWVIDLPSVFKYPAEQNRIETGYLKIGEWISSHGIAFTDWYSNTNAGYRDNSKLFNP